METNKIPHVIFLLHYHLPWVYHPEYETFLEEQWLLQAINETYLPVLHFLNRLHDEGNTFKLNISFSPTLINMLKNDYFIEQAREYLEKRIQLAEREIERTSTMKNLLSHRKKALSGKEEKQLKRNQPLFNRTAHHYKDVISRNMKLFNDCDGKILDGYADLYHKGRVELITCGATHAFFPLLRDTGLVNGQIGTAIKEFERVFDFKPRGFFIPECAYFNGLEELIEQNGFEYFFVESHGIEWGEPFFPQGVHNSYNPIPCSRVKVFGRNLPQTNLIWHSKEGFPGSPCYRESHLDIGNELEYDYIKDFLLVDIGIPMDTGFRYHRVTDRDGKRAKRAYDLKKLPKQFSRNVDTFIRGSYELHEMALEHTQNPVLVPMFDAELFGHWWYEGPEFLYHLIRLSQDTIKYISPLDYIAETDDFNKMELSMSTWGRGGYYDFWLNDHTIPYWLTIWSKNRELTDVLRSKEDYTEREKRILNSALKHLMLAQASDWPFMLASQNFQQYVAVRYETHLGKMDRLLDMFRGVRQYSEEEFLELDIAGFFESVDFTDFLIPG